MAVLHVRNIPDKIYKPAQVIAAKRGVTLSAHILELLEADIATHEARKRHQSIMAELRRRPYHAPAPAPDAPSTSDVLLDLRRERERELP